MSKPPRRAEYVNRLYGRRWRTVSKAHIQRNPLCVRCGRGATVCDHIVPHKGDEQLFHDATNLQSLCKSCHDRKTVQEDGGWGQPMRVSTDQTKCADGASARQIGAITLIEPTGAKLQSQSPDNARLHFAKTHAVLTRAHCKNR
jgi:5-methylcytosine-specific restriction enzyme A